MHSLCYPRIMDKITVYHSSFSIIEKPDIFHGRTNADFGQGFYVSRNKDFSLRWAKARKNETSYINVYELDTNELNILHLQRDENWFSYIFDNRNRVNDLYKDYDLIIGPIANDTIYDTFGIITSGILSKQEAMKLLMIGPSYEQIVLKSKKAADHLEFRSYITLSYEEAISYRDLVLKEQEAYQKQFTEVMKTF